LGEYYTPDWLAEYMVEKTLDRNPEKSILDPSCGSGTFLAAAIRRKKTLLKNKKPRQQLDILLSSISGVDIHPLAVILSRANFLTSLGTDLLSARRGSISVPVFMADSIRLPEMDVQVYSGVKSFKIEAEQEILRLPLEIAEDPNFTDRIVSRQRILQENCRRRETGT
ncbi:MAG: N-6 DNA methylase, partial [Rhabdochlamydiaceae bacterium]